MIPRPCYPSGKASFENQCVESLLSADQRNLHLYPYQTADRNKDEIDLAFVTANKLATTIETKRPSNPVLPNGRYHGCNVLGTNEQHLVCPIEDSTCTTVSPLSVWEI